jgi:hypothetical protein
LLYIKRLSEKGDACRRHSLRSVEDRSREVSLSLGDGGNPGDVPPFASWSSTCKMLKNGILDNKYRLNVEVQLRNAKGEEGALQNALFERAPTSDVRLCCSLFVYNSASFAWDIIIFVASILRRCNNSQLPTFFNC